MTALSDTSAANPRERPATDEDVYPSRTGGPPRLLPRQDPVIRGECPLLLGVADWERYIRRGHLTLEGFLAPPDVRALGAEVHRLRDEYRDREAVEVIRQHGSGAGAVRSIFAPHRLSPVVDRFTRNAQILTLVEAVLGGPAYIHQARINYKPAYVGKEFFWHSDFETWHVEDGMPRMRAVSCSINLTENNHHNGPLMLVPGSHETYVVCPGRTPENHHEKSLVKQEYGVPTDTQLSALVDRGGIAAARGVPGSLTLFDCNTMHGSNGNITPWPRTNLFLVYNSVENRLRAPYCGLASRPEHIAAREHVDRVVPAA